MLSNILILLFIILFTYLFIKKDKLAIFLIILLLPTYLIRLNFFNIPTTFLELMIISSIFGFLYQIVKFRPDIRFYKFLLPIVFLFITTIVSIKASDNSIAALGVFKAYFLEPILFFIIFINKFKTEKELNLIINILGISVLYLSIYAIFQKITGVGIPDTDKTWILEPTRRVTSFFQYPNALGLYISPIVVLYIGRIKMFFNKGKIKENKLYFIFNIFVIIFGFLSVLFASSEGGLVAIIVSTLFILFLYSKEKLRFILILLITISTLFFIPKTQKIIDTKIFLKDYSGKVRTTMWVETKNMIKDNFILGAGLSNYKNKIQKYKANKAMETFLYPHNIILNFWSEIGLFGLLIFILILYRFFRKCFLLKNKNKLFSVAISATMFSLIVHGLVDVPYFKNDLSILFWIIIGLIIIIEKIDDNEIEVIKNVLILR